MSTSQEVKSDALSRLIAEHVRDSIILMDALGRVVWVNPAFTELNGYALEDALGKKPSELLCGSATTLESSKALAKATSERSVIQVDVVTYKQSGQTYVAETKRIPIVDHDGELIHLVDIQRDVSEERALKQDSIDFKAYQRALDLQAIVSVTDARGKITFVNPKFTEISGYSPEELIGKTHRIVNSGYHDRSLFVEMWRTIRRGETWHGEVCNRNKAGDIYWVDTTVVPVQGPDGKILRYVSTRYDITDRKRSELELERLALTDGLTGLANRTRFLSMLKELLATEDGCGLIALIDLDHFKVLNDSKGHFIGDLLLKETASRMKEFVGKYGTVARLGGDEFGAIIHCDAVARAPKAFIDTMHKKLSEPTSLEGAPYVPSFSLGVAQYPQDGASAEMLLTNADIALYDAKRNGRDAWRFFDSSAQKRIDHRERLESIVVDALANEGFTIALQPICSVTKQEHVGFEVLARLFHDGIFVPPDQFIPVAEEQGHIPAIGRLVLEKSFAFFGEMKNHGLHPGRLAVNVSPAQFREPGFAEEVQDLLFRYCIAPTDLVLEITETALIGRSKELVEKTLCRLRAMGISISLDDFGTGFSSLSHLRDFSVDEIKVDKSFVQDLEASAGDRALIKGLVELAHCLDLSVVAEGVETLAQFEYVRDLGVDFAQGFFHARPLSPREAEEFLSHSQTSGLRWSG
ncbi:EAL domain-containing protein [Phaeobacter gallaeciensis]|uniref:putative bifunctional diguanylate cyclase/phosphodiesterase n=1 Tax=Phaeobacter gallaeciensis TaxID=60890 RepID=UPI0023800A1B|nr:EAL domain-containing protein [Phaeobacter gallaeciensis]MDE4276803.1 EAL domain-containing protein [Phaeobacter gallaeciensis]MDE4302038.1 EAL domain-containing protein [Phaeobacter gallaeciensis]MDE5187225.1 EAL domain-containing protein [Phaeobacter gallaeciensis]